MRHKNKIEEQKDLIKDLSAILEACDKSIRACWNSEELDTLRRDLVITYEERERQYKKLEQMIGV